MGKNHYIWLGINVKWFPNIMQVKVNYTELREWIIPKCSFFFNTSFVKWHVHYKYTLVCTEHLIIKVENASYFSLKTISRIFNSALHLLSELLSFLIYSTKISLKSIYSLKKSNLLILESFNSVWKWNGDLLFNFKIPSTIHYHIFWEKTPKSL